MLTPLLVSSDPRDRGLRESLPGHGGDEGADEIDLITGAVLAVPGVHDLHAGVLGEAATYLPGRRVNGLRMREPGCDIHVVLDWGVPVGGTAAAIRAAVRPYVPGPVDVTVEDVADLASPAPETLS